MSAAHPVRKHSLSHPVGSGYRFDKRRKVLLDVNTNKIVAGILNTNRALFYPHYSYARATLTANVISAFQCVTSSIRSGVAPGMSQQSAIRRGTLLDSQIERTTRLFKRHKLTHAYFYDASARDAWTKTVVPPEVKRYASKLLPHTRACWQALEHLTLSPVATQVAVGCNRMKRATMIDLVCIDTSSPSKLFIPIEIKSGFNNYYYSCTDKRMNAPFHKQTDCVFNQHQIQLLIGAELYRRSYWKDDRRAIGTPLLMRFRTDDDGNVASDIHPLRQWAKDALPLVIPMIMNL